MELVWNINAKKAVLFIQLDNGRGAWIGEVNLVGRTDYEIIEHEKKELEQGVLYDMRSLLRSSGL